VIYNSSSSQASLYLGSQKFQRIFLSLPSPPPLRPSQCTLIILLLVTTQHTGSKKLALISENLQDISHYYTLIVIYRSSTDRWSFPYLDNFMAAGSWVGTIEISFPMFHYIHLAPKNYVIYNSTLHSLNSQASLYPSSQKFSKNLFLPSIPTTFTPFLMHINYALISFIRENLEDISH
jgi:hypothetical protein